MVLRLLKSLRRPLRVLGLEDKAISLFKNTIVRKVSELFYTFLLWHTKGYSELTWLGKPIWQAPLDLWTIQETIWDVQPELLIECGTNRGGSAFFYAQLFDLMGKGRIVTMDIEKMHDYSHPRIEYLLGSSVSDEILDHVRAAVAATTGPILVILDSDHSAPHVRRELELYAPLVTKGSYMIVQDTIIDTHPAFRSEGPGPLVALKDFLKTHPEFEIEEERSRKFPISHHPHGWLRKIG